MTTFQKFNAGKISGFGSFHTGLLNLYKIADEGNRRLLDSVFPEWFVEDKEKAATEKREAEAEAEFFKSHPELNP